MKSFRKSKVIMSLMVFGLFFINSSQAALVQWTGALNTKWSNAANWTVSGTGVHMVPGATDDVEITNVTNQPSVDISPIINSLLIDNGAQLSMAAGINLNVNGDVNIIGPPPGSSLTIGGGTLMLTGSFTGGTVDATAANSTLIIGGDMNINSLNTTSKGSSTVILNGNVLQNVVGSYHFNNLEIDNSSGVDMNGNITVDQDLTGTGNFVAGTYTLTFKGSNMTVASFTAGTSTVNLWGSVQNINGYTFNNVNQKNTQTQLQGNVTVNGTLSFNTGNILCGSYNLTIGSSGSISSAGISTGYIITDAGGALVMNAGTGGTLYPVGHSATEYNPVTLTSASGAVSCQVSVADGLTDQFGSAVTSHAVNATWAITPVSAGSVSISTQWTNGSSAGALSIDPQQELTGFDESNVYLCYRTATTGSWTYTSGPHSSTSSGTDPLTISSYSNVSLNTGSTYYVSAVDYYTSISPLPVKLTAFDAIPENQTVLLQWTTSSEINNDYFEILRSANGINWQSVTRVAGNGTTQQLHNYSFNDQLNGQALAGAIYYRLKQVDFNGAESLSPIRSIKLSAINSSAPAEAINIYPNPADNEVNIDFSGADDNSELRIINAAGVLQYAERINRNEMHTRINTGLLNPGMYVVQIVNKDNIVTGILIRK